MAAKQDKYCFPLSIQMVLPENYRQDGGFQSNLKVLQELGFCGVELNIADIRRADIADICDFLGQFDLRLTMFASGLTAKTNKLSLSSADPETRSKSVRECIRMIDFVKDRDAGIIIGYLKGGASQDVEGDRERFLDSLGKIAPLASEKKVGILVEATNRRESSVANTIEDAAELVKFLDCQCLGILPDTYHMNIEEADWRAALKKYSPYYKSIHLSDDNRFFPGLGAIDFNSIIGTLKQTGYRGGVAIEGNLKTDFIRDIRASAEYLHSIMKS
jgi:sugar phosphate isomerase/epimerase